MDVLGDLVRSLALHQLLATRSRGAFCFPKPTQSAGESTTLDFDTAKPAEVTFGVRASVEADVDAQHFGVDRVLSPLEEMRAHFQLPERSLFVNFRLPVSRDVASKRVSGARRLRFGILCDREVATTPVAVGCFRPNVLPVQNLDYLPAQPIKDEGYRVRYPLRQPEELAFQEPGAIDFEIQAISRVVALDNKGETPLVPSSFGDAHRCFRVTRGALGFDNQYYIELAQPGAKPCRGRFGSKPRGVSPVLTWSRWDK